MKRFIIIGAVVAALAVLLLVWFRSGGTVPPDVENPNSPPTAGADTSESPAETNARTYLGSDSASVNSVSQPADLDAELAARIAARDERMRLSNEAGNPAVAFFGKVVDQDSNALQNVSVDLAVIEEYVDPYPQVKTRNTPLKRQTGADGRFEVSGAGLKGKYVTVSMLTKEGYEQEIPGRMETFGTQVTSFENPAVFRMWSTNLHEPLIGGEKSFDLVPDGRHYVIDLKNRTITEGETGDLVVWMKRPQTVVRGERFAWSCKVSVPSGGLLESQNQAMFIAPESGYTNLFAFQEQESDNGSGSLQDKRFYIRLSNGMYGRIVISLYPNFHRTKAGLILISYAINPSGSRLLR